jgi:cell division protein FtsL
MDSRKWDDMAKDKVATPRLHTPHQTKGEKIVSVAIIVFVVLLIVAFVQAANNPNAYTTPDCYDGTESCNQ